MKKLFASLIILAMVFVLAVQAFCAESTRKVIPARSLRREVDERTMARIYEQVKTPPKYGIILRGEGGRKLDCPSVFRHADKWYMIYIIFDGNR